MDLSDFFEKYFIYIILFIVFITAILVGISIFGLNFTRKKNQKITKKVSFAAGI